jgi:hypothetical protein
MFWPNVWDLGLLHLGLLLVEVLYLGRVPLEQCSLRSDDVIE